MLDVEGRWRVVLLRLMLSTIVLRYSRLLLQASENMYLGSKSRENTRNCLKVLKRVHYDALLT